MYRVIIDKRLGRVLVSGKDEDLKLTEEGWDIVFSAKRWIEAYEYARQIADKHNYILEWYMEEEKQEIKLIN